MSRNARIDIVCAAFNRSDRIRPTIDSVLGQTVQDWMLVVVSDGSTDDTEDVVRSYRDPRIRLLRVAPHGHPGGPRNVGVAHTRSPFVCYIDHDDRWLPEHLETVLGRLEAGAGFVATGCVRVDDGGTELSRTGPFDTIWHPELQTLHAMFEPSRVGHARPLLAEVGGWTRSHAGYEDWDLWYRMARAGHDVTVAEERTAVQVIGARTRRNDVRAPHAVVIGRTPDAHVARRVLEALASTEHRVAARTGFRAEMRRWYADLAGTARYHGPTGAALDARLRAFDHGDRPGLLEQLVSVPDGDGVALVLPLWCTTREHVRDIGAVLVRRYPHQRRYLQALLAGTRVPDEPTAV